MAKEIKSLLLAVFITIGVYLSITSAGPATQTAQFAGQPSDALADAPPQVTLTSDAQTSFGAKTVRLIDVAATGNSVILEINGGRHVVAHYAIIDGLKIYVIETFYSNNPAERSATLVIAEV